MAKNIRVEIYQLDIKPTTFSIRNGGAEQAEMFQGARAYAHVFVGKVKVDLNVVIPFDRVYLWTLKEMEAYVARQYAERSDLFWKERALERR